MPFSSAFLHCCAALLLPALAAAASSSDGFQLYGYGEGIGGLPVLSDGVTTTSTGWLGSPNTTVFTNPSDISSWSNKTFGVPSASSSSKNVLFVNGTMDSTSDVVTDLLTYGSYVFVWGERGDMESLWYALPSDLDGIFALKWNSTGDESDGKIPITLKKTPPSTST
ncbi:hypothetical protein N656DRAFT_832955 [Canariomyces notabilis]|uniref:Uncharacterized protein n=1 Tax=Canariomyces notabilis TaxID=2074819 RepID=A0AAN6QHR4_9PEZI|nr:hypothetical protein N656DRAFT_832955 [Canariomyces arenarius]